MLQAFRLGSIYFLLIPLLTFYAYGYFDVARPPTDVAFTAQPSLLTLMLSIAVVATVSLVYLLSLSRGKDRFIKQTTLRAPVLFRVLFFYFFAVEVANLFLIDRSLHWLETEQNYFVPEIIQFLMHPFQWFSWAIAIMIVCGTQVDLGIDRRLAWVVAALFIVLAVANSGNRILIALTFLYFYAYSTPNIKKAIILLSPLIAFVGFYISAFILAFRVNADYVTILNYLGGRDPISSFLAAVNLITEAINAAIFQSIFQDYWLDPEIEYGILRTIVTLTPGYSPVDTFNIQIANIYAPGTDMSLNSTIYGYFVYGFGFLGLPLLVFAMIGFYQIERYANDALVGKIMFVVVLAGVRFGLEFLIYCSVYMIATLIALGAFRRRPYKPRPPASRDGHKLAS